MKLIDQRTKGIMEGCKKRACDAGLSFGDSETTLEYNVTNRDLLLLSPKIMVPTLYDYWVHDVEVHHQIGKYSLYPSNPYETVINTRPAVSFYNDNNPDWLNIMIFYHVLAHIDFFRNNKFFQKTWSDDFMGKAAADRELINRIRREQGDQKRWVDYVIEFARAMDNLVGYYDELGAEIAPAKSGFSKKMDYFFGPFLSEIKERLPRRGNKEFSQEMERYNGYLDVHDSSIAESLFFGDELFKSKYPEFGEKFKRWEEENRSRKRSVDLMEFIVNHSEFLSFPNNSWMSSVIQVVRETSLFFQPQIRTKIFNEGWASLWHDRLFLQDDRLSTNEVKYAKINAGVTSISRLGLNPYAIGLRLLQFIEEMAEKGKLSFGFQKTVDSVKREEFDDKTGKGLRTLFDLREGLNDFMLINLLHENDFQDFVTRHKLFVTGQRINPQRRSIEYFVKSRNGEDYRKMLKDHLYHPPSIEIDRIAFDRKQELYLKHRFEGKPLLTEWISPVLRGFEFLWRGKNFRHGGPVKLETTEFKTENSGGEMIDPMTGNTFLLGPPQEQKYKKVRVLYTMDKGTLKRTELKL
ncbi:MAG: SpoVR family protein [Patescibacteria group bacterium]